MRDSPSRAWWHAGASCPCACTKIVDLLHTETVCRYVSQAEVLRICADLVALTYGSNVDVITDRGRISGRILLALECSRLPVKSSRFALLSLYLHPVHYLDLTKCAKVHHDNVTSRGEFPGHFLYFGRTGVHLDPPQFCQSCVNVVHLDVNQYVPRMRL